MRPGKGPPMTDDLKDRVIEMLWPDDRWETDVYAVLDSARDDAIYDAIMSSRLEWSCLYSGNIPSDLARVAPYVIKLKRQHFFTESLIRDGWGRSWGIFLRSSAGLEELRKHFHSFLTVEDEDGKRLIFRYYDPRIFRLYLPTCRLNELSTVFGPVKNYMMEASDPTVLMDFRILLSRLSTAQHSLLHPFAKETAPDENLSP